MEVYIFSKPGFKERQSEKLKDPNKRRAILVDCDLNRDPKMLTLYDQKDVSLLGILFEIWSNLDFETETWEIAKHHFDNWVRKTFGNGNRFDVLKRLQWLSNNGLIVFQYIPNDLPTPSQTPLEQVETLVPVISNNKQNKTKQRQRRNIKYSDAELQTAKFIFEKIRALNPDFSEPNFPIWANDIRLMVEQDKRSLESIKELYSQVSSHSFWRSVVLSPAKLREKWDRLTTDFKNKPSQSGRTPIKPHSERVESSGKL